MALVTGLRLGPYEVLGPIGAGGMGEVYRARDTRLGREVAVKVIPDNAGGIPDRLARFEREAQAIAALNHPNILALHDIGNDSGIVYAVMELLEGETLRARLEVGGPLTPLKAIDYASQIARGLAAAHERGILHRDLKPENLFITRDGRVKILDFGLAQQEVAPPSADWDARATRFTTGPGIVLGTPGYMSPEQVLGQPATVRSDLFAFGVVVHEMLTGAHPFRRQTPADTTAAILREDPPPLGRAMPGLPTGIVKILERCMDKHAGNRPASARDLAIFLDAIGSETGSSPVTAPAVVSDVRRVRRRLLAISCGLLALLSAATWGFVRVMTDRVVAASIDADLTRAERLVQRVQSDRLAALAQTARLVASFPDLKAIFSTNAATVRDFLVSYQQGNPEAPVLIALDPDGIVIARTDEGAASDGARDPFRTLLDRRDERGVVWIRERPYHAAVAVVEAAGNVFGYIAGVSPVNQAFAALLREATLDETVLLSRDAFLASTLRAAQSPWRSLEEWRGGAGRSGRTGDVSVGVQRFVAREVALAGEPSLVAVVLKSRDEATAPFRRLEDGVVAIGFLCAAVAVAGSLWIARVLTSAPTPHDGGST